MLTKKNQIVCSVCLTFHKTLKDAETCEKAPVPEPLFECNGAWLKIIRLPANHPLEKYRNREARLVLMEVGRRKTGKRKFEHTWIYTIQGKESYVDIDQYDLEKLIKEGRVVIC